jgi:purine-binding chemotaxis protein CheW
MDPRHVLFRSGGERFALPLEAVAEVVPPAAAFAYVPRAPPAVVGDMNVRGRVVAVVEMAALLGLPAAREGAGQVLVLDRERRTLGFLVDEVLGVEPVGEPDRAGEGPPVRGLATARGAPGAVLDPGALAEAARRLFRGAAA